MQFHTAKYVAPECNLHSLKNQYGKPEADHIELELSCNCLIQERTSSKIKVLYLVSKIKVLYLCGKQFLHCMDGTAVFVESKVLSIMHKHQLVEVRPVYQRQIHRESCSSHAQKHLHPLHRIPSTSDPQLCNHHQIHLCTNQRFEEHVWSVIGHLV